MVKLKEKDIKIKLVNNNNKRKLKNSGGEYDDLQKEGDIDVEIDGKYIYYIDNKALIGMLFDEIQDLKDRINQLENK